MSRHRGYYEFLESSWCWNLFPFLPDIGFQLLKSLWSSLTHFLFNDASNVLYRWKIWTAGRPIQHRTLLIRSHAVVTAVVCGFALSCWNTQGLPWNRRRLEGSICCSKTFIYSALQMYSYPFIFHILFCCLLVLNCFKLLFSPTLIYTPYTILTKQKQNSHNFVNVYYKKYIT